MESTRVFRPDPRYRTQLAAGVLLVFLLVFAPWALLALIPEIGGAFAAWYLAANAVWVIIALLLVPSYVRSIRYELGDQELIVKRGIITQATDLVPYHMVTNVALRRGPVARALGLGTLKVHTAGYSANSTAEATIVGVANYEELRQAILTRLYGAEPKAAAIPTGSEQALLATLVDEVRGLRADLQR